MARDPRDIEIDPALFTETPPRFDSLKVVCDYFGVEYDSTLSNIELGNIEPVAGAGEDEDE